MSAVIAGLTVAELVQIACTVIGQSGTIWSIIEKLRADGAKDNDLVPKEHFPAIAATMHQTANSFDPLGNPDGPE